MAIAIRFLLTCVLALTTYPLTISSASAVSKDQTACTMCYSCENPCQPLPSPPPPVPECPPPPAPPPPSPPPPSLPECPPPPVEECPACAIPIPHAPPPPIYVPIPHAPPLFVPFPYSPPGSGQFYAPPGPGYGNNPKPYFSDYNPSSAFNSARLTLEMAVFAIFLSLISLCCSAYM
ncbi:leucine-rich repeat extensin-like protein 3 [Ricinus communis]|uniref:Nutrient reservoir, putative n=1 Tax=Ricinus communis TaxID=3988 RepID=B9RNI9_RICCO|nr:leucine-rich repeat extensin-like protein 3 [Ricinus communis]EEF47312.1 nutrient reservoir, putative [Ricinus communis]|eukprot:XP_002515328.1 leucine-rich repeat extensin-like protein 3 [Ricinus communis]